MKEIPQKIDLPSPSDYMRAKRPELYSDTEEKSKYKLSESELNFALSTLTEQNRHKDFELFCRAVAQREICSNLRPQTGPEGGGDGKVDTETYPVSPEISDRFVVGTSGDERWAFTVSAKKTWKSKIQNDVKGVVETKRPYAQIHAFTNQNPRAKIRLELEDDLKKEHGISITIYDRNWLVEKTIENGHQDLANRFLGVGNVNPSEKQTGARDTAREAELEHIENSLTGKNGVEKISGYMAVEASRRSAQLSRELEKPRVETEGRYARAITLARKEGESFDLLRAIYDKIWTAVFWFDDFGPLLEHFDEIERISIDSQSCHFLEKHSTLVSLLSNLELRPDTEIWGDTKYSDRAEKITEVLKVLSSEHARPNHALYAESIQAFVKMGQICVSDDRENMAELYMWLVDIVERSDGLGEYPLGFVETFVEIGFMFKANQSPAFFKFAEVLSDRTGQRDGDIRKGEMLSKMGHSSLDGDNPIDAITYFGRAATALAKEETQLEYTLALAGLVEAYELAGLHWAARGARFSMMVAMENAVISNDIPKKYKVHAAYDLAIASLLSGHIIDAIFGIFLSEGLRAHLGLSKDDDNAHAERFSDFDGYLSCALGSWPKKNIASLDQLPDILDRLGLFLSSSTLLYRLGHSDKLDAEGLFEGDFDFAAFKRMVDLMPSQPLVDQIADAPVNYSAERCILTTIVVGVTVDVESGTSADEIAVAEAFITGVEAFAATLPSANRAIGLTNKASVKIVTGNEYSVVPDLSRHSLVLTWPNSKPVSSATRGDDIPELMFHAVCALVTMTVIIEDVETVFKRLVEEERLMERNYNYGNPSVARNRIFGAPVGNLSDLSEALGLSSIKTYSLTDFAPETGVKGQFAKDDDIETAPLSQPVHSQYRSQSLINTHLWDAARWKGLGFVTSQVPGDISALSLVFHFENPIAGRRIFENWRELIGSDDTEELIRVSLLTGINAAYPAHYKAGIDQNFRKSDEKKEARFVMISRHLDMMPENSSNLDRFLERWSDGVPYMLAPMIQSEHGLIPDSTVGIMKRQLNITPAWKVGPGHREAMIMTNVKNPLIPKGQPDPPFAKLGEMYKSLKQGVPIELQSEEKS